jgi:hypothetical protein
MSYSGGYLGISGIRLCRPALGLTKMSSISGSLRSTRISGTSRPGSGCWNGKPTRVIGTAMDDLILGWLLVAVGALSLTLILAATATLGRKLADLEYQRVTGINGVRRLQAWINARTHANRVFLGLTFLTTSVLAISDVPPLWRTWIGRVLFILVLLAYTVSSVLDWLDERRQVKLILAEQRAGVAPDLRMPKDVA